MPTTIRRATLEDAPALVRLWQEAGLGFRPHEVEAELASVLARDPELVLVAEDEQGVVGSLFGAFDGRRAWVNRLATRTDRRGEGIAGALMDRLEDELKAKGCLKVNLLVQRANPEAVGFYEKRGYVGDDVVFLGKRLVDEPADEPAEDPPGA